KKNDPF
ncbi:hypothetical protein HID58_004155, partial [Brassica napus]